MFVSQKQFVKRDVDQQEMLKDALRCSPNARNWPLKEVGNLVVNLSNTRKIGCSKKRRLKLQ